MAVRLQQTFAKPKPPPKPLPVSVVSQFLSGQRLGITPPQSRQVVTEFVRLEQKQQPVKSLPTFARKELVSTGGVAALIESGATAQQLKGLGFKAGEVSAAKKQAPGLPAAELGATIRPQPPGLPTEELGPLAEPKQVAVTLQPGIPRPEPRLRPAPGEKFDVPDDIKQDLKQFKQRGRALGLATAGLPAPALVEQAAQLQKLSKTITKDIETGDLTPDEARTLISTIKSEKVREGTLRDVGYAVPGVGTFLSFRDAQRSGFSPLDTGFFVFSAATDALLFIIPAKAGAVRLLRVPRATATKIKASTIRTAEILKSETGGVRLKGPGTSAEELGIQLEPIKKPAVAPSKVIVKERRVIIPETAPTTPKVSIPELAPTKGPLKIPTVKRTPTPAPELPGTGPRPLIQPLTQPLSSPITRSKPAVKPDRLKEIAEKARESDELRRRREQVQQASREAIANQQAAEKFSIVKPKPLIKLSPGVRERIVKGDPLAKPDAQTIVKELVKVKVITQPQTKTIAALFTQTTPLTRTQVQTLTELLAKVAPATQPQVQTEVATQVQVAPKVETQTAVETATETATETKVAPKVATVTETEALTATETALLTETQPVVSPLVQTGVGVAPEIRTAVQPVTAPEVGPTRPVSRPVVPIAPGRPIIPPPPFRFSLPSGKKLPPGVFPRVVVWKQGFQDVRGNLQTGEFTFQRTKVSGVPDETFRVVSLTREPPVRQILPLGIVDVLITRRMLEFVQTEKAKKRSLIRRQKVKR